MSYKALEYKKGGSPFKISGPCKAAAKRKFDVYPSAYANAWGVRCTKAGGPGSMGKKSEKQFGGVGIDFRTKDEIKDDKKAQRKEDRENRQSERRAGRKVKRYSRVGRRKEGEKEGSGNAGLAAYRKRLRRRKKVKGAIRKAARFPGKVVGKIAKGVKARAIARRNRRKLDSGKGSGCQGKGCGAYE